MEHFCPPVQDRRHASDTAEIKMMNNNDTITTCVGVCLCCSVILTLAFLNSLSILSRSPSTTLCQQGARIHQATLSSCEETTSTLSN